ncbi:hypothetical protein BXO88_15945 [Oribacterium sp. C9]|nr:hypothetical protein BXO88_15945 [Oribacterium sp. C9]
MVKAPFNHFDEAEKRMSSKIHTVSNRFIKDIQSKKIYPAQKVFKSVIFNIGIRPFVKKKGLAYHGVMEKWDNIGIQLK